MNKHAVEIGAGDGYSSQLLPIATGFERVELYEPHEGLYGDLVSKSRTYSHVIPIRAAVGPQKNKLSLVHLGYASYLVGLPSFLRTSCEPEAEEHWTALTKPVAVMAMDDIDDGSIDCLVLTCNGAEIGILLTMKSRPAVIRTKHYCHSAQHWDVAQSVFSWMQTNGYVSEVLERNEHATFHHLQWMRV